MIIGPGPSPTIDPLIKYFDEFILIEPNKFFINEWKQSLWWKKCGKFHKKIIIIPTVIEYLCMDSNNQYRSKLKQNSIDVIISTHVAYYYPNEYMTNITAYLLSLLKQNIGILSTGIDDDNLDLAARLMRKINPRYKCSELVENALSNLNMKYTKLLEFQEFRMEDINDAANTVRFFVIEGAFNKNWFSQDELTEEQITRLNKIISDAMDDENVKDENGYYTVPNYTVHYLVEMKHNISSKL